MKVKPVGMNWSFWLQWTVANAVGWTAGVTAIMTWDEAEFGPLAGVAVVAIAVGIAQWCVLRRRIYRADWWVWASVAGAAIGGIAGGVVATGVVLAMNVDFESQQFGLALLVVLTVLLISVGTGVGITQWLILRLQVQRAGWWVLASALSWLVGIFAGAPGVYGIIVAAAIGMASGGVLLKLWQHPLWDASGQNEFSFHSGRFGKAGSVLLRLPMLIGTVGLLGLIVPRWLQPCGWLDSLLGRSGCVRVLHGSRGSRTDTHIHNVVFSPDGTMLALDVTVTTLVSIPAGYDVEEYHDEIWVRQIADGKLLHTLPGPADGLTCFAFSRDERDLAMGSWDGKIQLWRVSEEMLLRELAGHASTVSSVAFVPDGTVLASASWDDGTVRLWRVSDGALLRTLEADTDGVTQMAFAPNGTTLALGLEDGRVQLWRVTDGTLLHTLRGHTRGVASLIFSPDGATLASASTEFVAHLWQVDDGVSLSSLQGRADGLVSYEVSMAFSSNTALLALEETREGGDESVQLWRLNDKKLLRTLEPVIWTSGVSLSPDGTMLAMWKWDGKVQLWKVEP